MRKIFLLMMCCRAITSFAQKTPNELAEPIVSEGKLLYRSEMASWYGTDLFLEAYKNRSNIGGYFSYVENETAKCIFFSKSDEPKVIGTIAFDKTYEVKKATVNIEERNFTSSELELYTIRKLSLQEINSDTLFKTYQNTNLNLIPLIHNNEKKVYVLTGPSQSGVVIFGNDYLLTFDANNKLLAKKQLHNNLIPIYTNSKESEGMDVVGTMHSHLPETGEFITATDICTLMLYSKFTKWKQHNVVSKEYLNIWNCETNELLVLPMETVKKIDKDSKKRKKKE